MHNEYPASYLHTIRLHNSHILSPANSFEIVASKLFGVQSQVFNASAIAFAIRTQQQTYSQFIYELDTLQLIRLWGIRATLHIYYKDDWKYLLSFLSTRSNWFTSKMAANGVDINCMVNKVLDIIKGMDYFDRDVLINGGIDVGYLGPWGDLLIELNNRGHIFRRTNSGKKNNLFGNTWVVLKQEIKRVAQSAKTKRKIALNFFRAYAPATNRDFSHWLGITMRESQEYLRLIENELATVKCMDKEYYIEATNLKMFDRIYCDQSNDKEYHLLPKFDPLLLAYHDKTWIVGKYSHRRVWRVAGHVEGVILRSGKAIATWRYRLTRKEINFEVSPFDRRFSIKGMEKNCRRIAFFFERPIGTITLTEEFL
jgi:hypothetical protein